MSDTIQCAENLSLLQTKKYKAKEYFHQNIPMRTNIKAKGYMHLCAT
jgi:hypothetical protein